LAAASLAHLVVYLLSLRYVSGVLALAWLSAGAIAMAASAAAPHILVPRNSTGKISLRSVLQRCGAFWNILVMLSAFFMLIARFLSIFIPIAPRTSLALCAGVSLLICAYGVFEASDVRVVRLTLTTKKLPKGERVRVAQLSDLHIGPFMNVGHVARIVRSTLSTRADLIVITGDIVDGVVADDSGTLLFYRPFSKKLRELKESGPALGVWAVPGNHDHYENFRRSVDFIEDSGINMLRTERADLGNIVLLGADDLDHVEKSADPAKTKSQALIDSLSAEERGKFVLLLRHRPAVEQSSIGKFDLQLSGHTHGGQIFSLPSSRHRMPGRPKGLLDLGEGSYMCVSNGAGFVGPPMRFFAPAEIVVIDLTGE
jgi:predicted MPP superfamily phosphohydrolase